MVYLVNTATIVAVICCSGLLANKPLLMLSVC